jgi:hypothetical protein
MPTPLAEYNPELEAIEREQTAWPGEINPEVLSEIDELELSSELLAVNSEQELDQFLGRLIRTVGRNVGRIVPAPAAQAVGGLIKGVITDSLLPGGGAPGMGSRGSLGTLLGSRLASVAGPALGLELEGLSHEDQEFEAARRFVRFTGEAVNNAASASPAQDPVGVAQAAVAAAAQRLAPGLVKGLRSTRAGAPHAGSGRWIRQGRNVVVVNC